MSRRILRVIVHHIERHPRRLVATIAVMLFVSWTLAGWALYRTADLGHRGRVENCRALNELEAKIYVAIGDLDGPSYIQDRFVPSQHCEDLP